MGNRCFLLGVILLMSCNKDNLTLSPDEAPENYDWELTVEAPPLASFFASETQSYKVKSVCIGKESGERVARKWKVVGFEDSKGDFSMEAKPSWVKRLTLMEGEGGEGNNEGVALLSVEEGLSSADIELRRAPSMGTQDEPFDLSMHDVEGNNSLQNTANSYIVSAAGYYALPLVFGNAIKEGNINTSAYTSSKQTDLTLQILHDAKGSPIRSPYIEGAIKAKLLWADEEGVLRNVRLSEDKKHVLFEIDAQNVRNANALVGVIDKEGRVLWSWHVWIAPENVLAAKVCMNFLEMPIALSVHNLGWKEERKFRKSDLLARQARVKVKQKGAAGKEYVFTIKRGSGKVGCGNSDLKYQWGRKDPFTSNLKVAEGEIYFDTSDQGHTIAEAICRPNVCFAPMTNPPLEAGEYAYTNLYNWSQRLVTNLWRIDAMSSGHNVAGSEKTVYDPTPVGYKVPIGIAFNGFTKAGRSSNVPADWNVKGNYERGWHFRLSEQSAETLFFPATGYINGKGEWVAEGKEGVYWTSNPATGHTKFSGWAFFFSEGYVSPRFFQHYCSMAQSIRPMKE